MKNRVPQHVVQCVSDMWLAHSGVPEIVVDQGCELESTMTQACDHFVIDVRIIGTHAGWHQGLVERHGGLFVEIGSAAVCEFHFKGEHVAGHVHAGQERNTHEVRCHPSTDCVRTSIKKVSYLNKMRRTAICILLWKVMVQAGWRHKYGRPRGLLAGARSSRTAFDSVTKKITNGQRHVVPWDESLLLCAAAVQRPTECRHDATARTCSDPGCRWAEPNFSSDVNRTLLVAADTLRNASSQEAAAAEVVGNNF